jgi:hypothetical protein
LDLNAIFQIQPALASVSRCLLNGLPAIPSPQQWMFAGWRLCCHW